MALEICVLNPLNGADFRLLDIRFTTFGNKQGTKTEEKLIFILICPRNFFSLVDIMIRFWSQPKISKNNGKNGK